MNRRIPIKLEKLDTSQIFLGASWGVGNTLASFSAPALNDRAANKTSGTGKCGEIHTISFETSLYTPIFRKLINESAQTFIKLQKMASEEESKY